VRRAQLRNRGRFFGTGGRNAGASAHPYTNGQSGDITGPVMVGAVSQVQTPGARWLRRCSLGYNKRRRGLLLYYRRRYNGLRFCFSFVDGYGAVLLHRTQNAEAKLRTKQNQTASALNVVGFALRWSEHKSPL